jgi:hypothetical protein
MDLTGLENFGNSVANDFTNLGNAVGTGSVILAQNTPQAAQNILSTLDTTVLPVVVNDVLPTVVNLLPIPAPLKSLIPINLIPLPNSNNNNSSIGTQQKSQTPTTSSSSTSSNGILLIGGVVIFLMLI